MNTYYKDQLAKIEPQKFVCAVKFNQGGSTTTNWLPLNDESASEIVAYLKENYNVTEDQTTFGGNWNSTDILEYAASNFNVNLTSAQTLEIIQYIDKAHDCNVGITWDVIRENTLLFLENNNIQ